jgi:HAE1 family hydrophobic/amphiphilic exporter-1
MTSGNTDDLYAYAPQLEARLRESRGLVDISSDLQLTNPEVSVAFDRDRMAVLGLTAEQVEGALYNAFGSRQVSTIFTSTNEYPVLLRVRNEDQLDPSALSLLYVKSSRGWLGAPVERRARDVRRRSAIGQSHGSVAVGHAVVQSRARRRAG